MAHIQSIKRSVTITKSYTPDLRKGTQLIHINLLKLYKTSPNIAPDTEAPDTNVTPDTKDKPICNISGIGNVTTHITGMKGIKNSIILNRLGDYLFRLFPPQAEDITTILQQFPDVFGDHPKRCNIILTMSSYYFQA